jgi:hypothetical protein
MLVNDNKVLGKLPTQKENKQTWEVKKTINQYKEVLP